jgi:hypothetical protein
MISRDTGALEALYDKAREFLISRIPGGEPASILEHYLSLPDRSQSPAPVEVLYQRLLISAQNANMKSGVIGGSIGGVEKLSTILFDFDPNRVASTYGSRSDIILDEIEKKLNPAGKVRRTTRSIWPRYCETILSAAHFLVQFDSGEDFYTWANHLYRDKRSMAALPMIIAEEVYGIGYPLACDFLKELGFVNYGKPDVHLIELFEGLGLCHHGASFYEIQKIIVDMAAEKGVTAYNVDKLFWLIGSGKLYDHPEIGNKGSIGRNKHQFIDWVINT